MATIILKRRDGVGNWVGKNRAVGGSGFTVMVTLKLMLYLLYNIAAAFS